MSKELNRSGYLLPEDEDADPFALPEADDGDGHPINPDGASRPIVDLFKFLVDELSDHGLAAVTRLLAAEMQRRSASLTPALRTPPMLKLARPSAAVTSIESARRDLEWLRQGTAHAASPETVPPPDLALLASNDPARPEEDLMGQGVVKRATVVGGMVVVQLAETRQGPTRGSLRRGRALAPPVACAFRVLSWYGLASTGRLTADPHTAWLYSERRTGSASDCEAAALALFDLNHEASGLPFSRSEYREMAQASLALVEAHFTAVANEREGRRSA